VNTFGVAVHARWSRLRSWLRSISSRTRLEDDMEEELRFHLEARTADLIAEGLSPREAARQARIEFGGIATHKDNVRRSLGLRWWDDLRADLVYATRILRKSPGFTLIAVSSLALAIGANTTIFSVANELLYERLGVPHPEQLRLFMLTGDKKNVIHSSWGMFGRTPDGLTIADSFSYPVYQQLRRNNKALQQIFAFKDLERANVTINGNAQAAQVELVSGNFYQQMDVRPALGRAILPSDDGTPSTGAVAIISDGLSVRAFGRSSDAVGKVITVNMSPVTIIGVNAPGFTGAKSVQVSPDIFMPLSMIPLLHAESSRDGPILTSTRLWWVNLIARAKPGISDEQARGSLEVALTAAIRNTMSPKAGETMPRLELDDGSRGLNFVGKQFAKPLRVLMVLVGFVLLLACANVANLMLARTYTRQREMSVRLALGAARSRILRQVLAEGLLLSVIGGTLGLIFGYLGRTALPKLVFNAWENVGLNVPFNWKVFCFTAAITLFTGILRRSARLGRHAGGDQYRTQRGGQRNLHASSQGHQRTRHHRLSGRSVHSSRRRSGSLHPHPYQSQLHRSRLPCRSPSALRHQSAVKTLSCPAGCRSPRQYRRGSAFRSRSRERYSLGRRTDLERAIHREHTYRRCNLVA